MRNRVFFPQGALDEWLAGDRVDLKHDELLIKAENRRYKIIEAIRVLREVSGLTDANEVVGKVKTRAYFNELGAEILGNSMILGDNAYDVVQGFAGAPVSNPVERPKTPVADQQSLISDEELLAAFLASKL